MSGNWWKYIIIAIFALTVGLVSGSLAASNSYESKSSRNVRGTLRLAYDEDDPTHPAMGLMIDSMEYLMANDTVTLGIERKNFPNDYEYSREKKPL